MQRIDRIDVRLALPDEVIRANITRNLDRGLPAITDSGDWRENMPIAIVGAGPSLKDTLPELMRFVHVVAAGSVHDYLVENGVSPTWTVITDPDPVMAGYLTKPSRNCKYLVASVCDDAVFRALKYQRVYVWNVFNSAEDQDFYDGRDVVLIGGGCTVGTRAMFVAMGMGFTNQHLFGFDSCITDQHHAYGEFRSAFEKLGTITTVQLEGSDRTFLMAGYMLAQLFDVQKTLKRFAHVLRITVHGDGAIAELMRLGKTLGDRSFSPHGENDEKGD